MMHLPILAILIPLALAFSLPLIDLLIPRTRKWLMGLFGLTYPMLVGFLVFGQSGIWEYPLGGWGAPLGIVLVVDGISRVFAALIALGTLMITWYALEYIDEHEGKFYVLFCILVAGMMGIVLTGDLFNLYVFVEMTSLASVPMVSLRRSGPSLVAGFRYLLFTLISGIFLLFSIILIYANLGTLDLTLVLAGFGDIDPMLRGGILSLLVVSLGLKCAIIPFFVWLPPAHSEAVAPVSALLSGVLLKTGLYMMLRLLTGLPVGEEREAIYGLLRNLGALTILGGHWLGLGQRNLKRLLAYSSIAHMGYMIMGLGLGSALALVGTLLHALNHVVMKSGIFLVTGEMGAESFEFSDIVGRGRSHPLAGVAFGLCSLSLIGLPPLGSFASKWLLATAAVDAGHGAYAVVIAAGTLISAWYYGRLYLYLYQKPHFAKDSISSSGPLRTGVVLSLALLCLVLFFFATPIIQWLQGSVASW